ncbi:MAG: UDP-glucose 4-epimerase GalE [Terriglobia bacterium]
MKVLVTGGAGYIGSHTAKRLAEQGFEPVVLDDFRSGHRWAVQWGELVEGDLADCGLLKRVFAEKKPGAVIHFAGEIRVGESVRDPRKYFWANCVNTLTLLDAMREAEVNSIVFSSSAAVYGAPEVVPIPEDHRLRPVSPYGESKLFVERILCCYGVAFGLRWTALRYFNACGADPGGGLGEAHDPETHLIPLAIEAALGARPYLEVFGSDYPTADGTPLRDYIHVIDLAEAHVLAVRHLRDGGESCVLNLGTGQGRSVREVINAVNQLAGNAGVPVREGARRTGDPPSLVADPSLSRRILQWEPRHSTLEEIIETAWKWHASRGNPPQSTKTQTNHKL